MVIRPIEAEQTLDLRSRILRPGQNLEACRFPEDDLDATFHLGVFLDEKIVCNGTFMQQGHIYFPEARHPYRLRGMASDQKFQNKGLGSKLIATALQMLAGKNCDLLWFNARTSAEFFYQKLGFEEIGPIFDLPGVGPHKVMFKWLVR